jgi:hypothetical protein
MIIKTAKKLRRLYSKAIEKSKLGGLIWFLQSTHNMAKFELEHERLRRLPKGTLGKAVADFMDFHQQKFIPKAENHDVKHVLLGYGTSPEEEVRMQVYLIGNGNYTLPTIMFAALGIFMPELWPQLIMDYKNGRANPSIFNLTLKENQYSEIDTLRLKYCKNFYPNTL